MPRALQFSLPTLLLRRPRRNAMPKKKSKKEPVKHHVIAQFTRQDVQEHGAPTHVLPSVPVEALLEVTQHEDEVVAVVLPKSAWQKFLDWLS